MRRLIAQAGSRLIYDRLRDHNGGEMEHLIKAPRPARSASRKRRITH